MARVYMIASLLLIVIAFIGTMAIYPQLPDQIPTHWNSRGQVDDYGSKTWAAFLAPGIMVGLFGLLAAIPWLSPKNFEVDKFRATYWFIGLVITANMAFIHGLILWATPDTTRDITRPLLIAVLLMFGLIGLAMPRVERNFWVGIRTPWTIASNRVWVDTHRLCAKLFVAAAVGGILVVMLPLSLPVTTGTVVGLVLGASIVSVGYSLVHYKRLERRGELEA